MGCANVLLITTDQQRVDTLSCMGAPIGRTPHIDALARRGTLFGRCYVQNPVCIPSRACLQTGRYPRQHGVTYMEEAIDATPGLPPWEWTFFERLREAGYHTAAFGKIHMMPERGFDTMQVTGGKGQRWTQSRGMDIGPAPLGSQYAAWLEARHPGAYELIYEQRRRPEYRERMSALVHPLPASEHVETWIGNNIVDFLSSPPAQPWFVWCGFTGPHGPLDVPPEYLDHYAPDEMPEPILWDKDLRDRFPYRGHRPQLAGAQAVARAKLWIAYYHGLVDLLDDQVGRILEVMDRRCLWEDTLVLFTSDHGEMCGDLGLYGKGNFYEAVTRTPTIVAPPGGRVASSRFDGLVEMFDLAPTVLEYAGLPNPPHMAARSLRPELETGQGGREAVFCEYITNDRKRQGACIRTMTHKLALWTEGGEREGELYELDADPHETTNRYDEPALAGVRRELIERLLARRQEVDAPVPREEWAGALRR